MTTIQEARRIVANDVLGIPPEDFDGTPAAYARLSQAQQIRLTEGVARFITRNPQEFSPDQVTTAGRVVAAPNFGQPLQDTSIAGQVREFGSLVVDNAANVATGFASGLTRSVALAAGVLVLVYFLPAALRSWKTATK